MNKIFLTFLILPFLLCQCAQNALMVYPGQMPHELCYLDEVAPTIKVDLKYCGYDNFVGRPIDGYTTGRRAILRKDAAAALDNAGIVVNKNTIPYDTESPFKTSGIRVGTASITTRGMKEAEAAKIGGWIADILSDITNVDLQQKVKAEAAKLVAGFPVP